jgi:hypothetical protein
VKVLNKIYRKKVKSETFIDCCLTIADLYLFFLLGIGEDENFNFFTENELTNYPFFPETNPGSSAYIAIKKDNITRRYLLEYFGKSISARVLRYKFQKYLKFANMGEWEANTNGEDFPAILFVFALQKRKNHMKFYARGVLNKKFDENIEVFLTTKDKIHPGNKSIWEKV